MLFSILRCYFILFHAVFYVTTGVLTMLTISNLRVVRVFYQAWNVHLGEYIFRNASQHGNATFKLWCINRSLHILSCISNLNGLVYVERCVNGKCIPVIYNDTVYLGPPLLLIKRGQTNLLVTNFDKLQKIES